MAELKTLLDPDGFELFLLFVVPGFVAVKTHDLVVPAPTRNWADSLIELVSYSMVNFAMFFWLLHLLHQPAVPSTAYYAGMLFYLLVAPAGLALSIRYLRGWKRLRKLVLHPAPTSWDFLLAQQRPYWVLLHLKEGQRIGGRFSEESFASAFPNPEDIYLEEVWRIDEDGRFQDPIEQTAGVLVKHENCTHIEFFKMEDGHEHVEEPRQGA